MSAVLELDAISAGYGETEILHGIDLHVDRGEIVVIIGPNGAGKSTAMKAIFGLLNITAGTIRLAGDEITNTPPQQVVTKGVAFVPQSANVFVSLTVEENLEMGAYVSRQDPAGGKAQQPEHRFHRGRLAGAVGADDDHHLSGLDLERDAMKNFGLAVAAGSCPPACPAGSG